LGELLSQSSNYLIQIISIIIIVIIIIITITIIIIIIIIIISFQSNCRLGTVATSPLVFKKRQGIIGEKER
jgi:hypothetical protein